MKLSYLSLRHYIFGLSGLAGWTISRFLTENTEAPWYIDGLFRTVPLLTICFLSDFLLRRSCRTLYLTEESDTHIDTLELHKVYFVDPIPEKDIEYYRVTQVEKIHEGEVTYSGDPQIIILEGGVYLDKGLAVLKQDKKGKRFFRNVRIRTSP